MDFVLDGAMPETSRLGRRRSSSAWATARRDRFLGIDVLAGGDRLLQDADALLGRGRVEEDRVGGIGESGVEVGRPVGDAVQSCDGGEPLGVAADQQQAAAAPASPPTGRPPSARIGTSALARCCVEAIRPVAPLMMTPIGMVAM